MSLDEVYSLAHTAECRLELSTSRPDRDLRIVVGHLLHYESLRLRIVQIEHDIGRRERALTRQVNEDGQASGADGPAHINDEAGRTATDPTSNSNVEPTDETEYSQQSIDEPISVDTNSLQHNNSHREVGEPDEPALEDVKLALEGPVEVELVECIENIRTCPCQTDRDVPRIEQLWTLPPFAHGKPEIVHAIGQTAG